MWARVKGETENALLRLPFKAAHMFRPGVIEPLHEVKSKTAVYRLFCALGNLKGYYKTVAHSSWNRLTESLGSFWNGNRNA